MKGKTFTISEIKEILASAKKSKHNEIIFGIDVSRNESNKDLINGLFYLNVSLKENFIQFTTDVSDYIWDRGELESTLEDLFKKFGTDKYNIVFHHHKGEFHDKDIQVYTSIEKIPEIIEYLLSRFYKWSSSTGYSYFSK